MTYQTPASLAIQDWELQALLGVRSSLIAGSLEIDMHQLGRCLASRVAQQGRRDVSAYVGRLFMRGFELRNLYYPGLRRDGSIDTKHFGWDAGPDLASKAITNFLKGYEAWKMAQHSLYLEAS